MAKRSQKKVTPTREALMVLPPGVECTAVGLRITGKLSYSEWAEMMKRIQLTHRSMLWVLGDGFVYGENQFGEEFSQAIAEYSKQTQLNALWVSRRIEISRRSRDLSWSHHQEIAYLDDKAEQDRFLKDAAKNRWTVQELRQQIKLFRNPPPKLDWRDSGDGPEIMPEEPGLDMVVKPSRYYPEVGEMIGVDVSSEKVSVDGDLRHLIDLVRSLRTALRGDLSRGIKPDEAAASRYWNALDLFLARFV